MNRLTAVLVFLAVCVASTSAGKADLSSYTFEEYLADYGLSFGARSSAEYAMRQSLFQKELSRVQAHNAKNLSWREGLNRFSVLTAQEKKAFFGRSKGAHRQHRLQGQRAFEQPLPKDFPMKPVSELPKHVDWREKGVVTAVKDQGHCGSCWAFAATATVESHVAIYGGLLFDLSVQQMAMCSTNPQHCGGEGHCQGSTAELAFTYVASSRGLLQEYEYGYASYNGQNTNCSLPMNGRNAVATIDGYVMLPNNDYAATMNALATYGPLAINVDASTWHAYSGGVFKGCNEESPDVNHVVVLVGYGEDEETKEKYWLVRNSWNAGWGEKGYIRLARYDDEAEAHCGLDVTPQDGVACAGQDEPVKVCGTCGAIYDVSLPINARVLKK